MASSSQRRGASRSSPSGSQHPQHRTMPQSSPSGSQHRTMPQSSLSGSHQPNVSQPSESAGDNTLRSSNGKLPIIVHADGRITGVYSAKWSSRVGYWIRAIVPISYASWDKVDGSFKDEVWLKLMEEFQLNVNPTMGARKNIEKWMKRIQRRSIDVRIVGNMVINIEMGLFLERAQEYYDRVTSVEEQMAEEASEHGGEVVYDITCDPLAQVFGKDKGSRTSWIELLHVQQTIAKRLLSRRS
ncbi:hypothetical protein IFM89_014382 [Coptis chinensis]|uniref:Uncharacterized protein n=1 Tax=Coptis chinensis TaxID=261450 RepID=A0A835GW62_9MAGN|nr:hypothetical protein IFM89_014382 [Coptis chinensis]